MVTTLVFTPQDMPGLLIQADPTITPENAANYGPPLLDTALRYQINTPLRLSHWLAQLLHESGSLKYTESWLLARPMRVTRAWATPSVVTDAASRAEG